MNKTTLTRSYSTPTLWPRRRAPELEGAGGETEESTRLPSKILEDMPSAEAIPSVASPETKALVEKIEAALMKITVYREALVEALREQTCEWIESGTVAEILAMYLRVPAIQDDKLLPLLAEAVGRPDETPAGRSSLTNLLSLLASFEDEARHDPDGARFTRFVLRLLRCLDNTGASQTSNELQALHRMLQQMASDPGLSDKLRRECYSATESCDDRVLFHWLKLQDVWQSHGVDKGSHDTDPVAVARRARQALRQKFFLDWIDGYVCNLPSTDCNEAETCEEVDLVEIYLAFLVELHALLNLDGASPRPLYGDGWRMGRIDLDSNIVQRAARELHQSENKGFLRFLTTWPPMRSVLSRQFADRYEQLCDQLSDASLDKTIREQLQAELIQQSLSDQVSTGDLEHQVTKRKVALFDQGMLQLIQEYFQTRPELLEPVWLGLTVR